MILILQRTMIKPWHQNLEGMVVRDDYRVLSFIGEGGMGAVFEGRQEELKRRVALKFLHPTLALDEQALRRFRREAEVIATLSHPHVVQIYDFITEVSSPVIVMELVDGPSLTEVLRTEKRLPPRRTVALAIQVLSALEAAHDVGVVHRDLKPDNVILTHIAGKGEWARVVDFGIALMMEGTGATRMTASGMVLGTPGYMAPEQVLGGEVDGRVDLYALGTILYRALVGRLPYEAKNFDELAKALFNNPTPTEDDLSPYAPRELAHVVAQAMARDPSARFETARAMANALRASMGVAPEAVVTWSNGDEGNPTLSQKAGVTTRDIGSEPRGVAVESHCRPSTCDPRDGTRGT